MNELTAICPSCDNPIEDLPENLQEGDHVDCDNHGCFWEGIVDDIDGDGNVWFIQEEDDDKD